MIPMGVSTLNQDPNPERNELRSGPTLLVSKFLNQFRRLKRIITGDQAVDDLLFDLQFLQVSFEALPVLLAFFPLGKVQFRNNFLGPLKRDGFTVFVIIPNNVLLVFCSFGHNKTLKDQKE